MQPPPNNVFIEPGMSFLTAIKTCFKKYVKFSGRARRSEFWWFFLLCFVANIVINIAANFIPFFGLLSLVFFLPYLAVSVGRLHATGHSGWWLLIPIIVPPIGLVFAFMTYAHAAFCVSAILGYGAGFVCAVLCLFWMLRDSVPVLLEKA